jgi:hypothetical protein
MQKNTASIPEHFSRLNVFACEITGEFFDFYSSNPCNHPGYRLTSRNGRNHFLVISSAFGLLFARAGVQSIIMADGGGAITWFGSFGSSRCNDSKLFP